MAEHTPVPFHLELVPDFASEIMSSLEHMERMAGDSSKQTSGEASVRASARREHAARMMYIFDTVRRFAAQTHSMPYDAVPDGMLLKELETYDQGLQAAADEQFSDPGSIGDYYATYVDKYGKLDAAAQDPAKMRRAAADLLAKATDLYTKDERTKAYAAAERGIPAKVYEGLRDVWEDNTRNPSTTSEFVKESVQRQMDILSTVVGLRCEWFAARESVSLTQAQLYLLPRLTSEELLNELEAFKDDELDSHPGDTPDDKPLNRYVAFSYKRYGQVPAPGSEWAKDTSRSREDLERRIRGTTAS